jgi:hypothetical protein
MLRKESSAYDASGRSMMGVHTIIIEVVVPQPEMSHFTIMVDIASTTLRSSS